MKRREFKDFVLQHFFCCLGNLVAKMIKSKDLFASQQLALLNVNTKDKSNPSNKLHSLQTLLSLTEQDARELLAGLPAKELESGQDFI
jgi:hypothetical protein